MCLREVYTVDRLEQSLELGVDQIERKNQIKYHGTSQFVFLQQCDARKSKQIMLTMTWSDNCDVTLNTLNNYGLSIHNTHNTTNRPIVYNTHNTLINKNY